MNLAEMIFNNCSNKEKNNEMIAYINDHLDEINEKYSGWTALGFAVLEGNIELVQYLIKKGIDIKIGCYSSLFANLLSDSDDNTVMQIMTILVKAGADINVLSDQSITDYPPGMTLLDIAALANKRKLFDHLIKLGADKEKALYPKFVNEYDNSKKETLTLLLCMNRHRKNVKSNSIFSTIYSYIPEVITKKIAEYTLDAPEPTRSTIIKSLQH